MSYWETKGKSDDWQTPAYIFDALGECFDLDVAAPLSGGRHVPALKAVHENSLLVSWNGFVWMNPPFGGRNGLEPWLRKFIAHNNGIALVPDRTSAPWWQEAASHMDAILFVNGKIKFEKSNGELGKSPSNGTTLMALSERGTDALKRAAALGLGLVLFP